MHVGHTHHHLHSLRHSSLVFYTSQLSVDTLDAFPLSVAFAQCSIQDKEQWAGKKTIAGESKGPRRATLGTLREEREATTAVTSYGTSSSLQVGKNGQGGNRR